jgi:hypothetical protein
VALSLFSRPITLRPEGATKLLCPAHSPSFVLCGIRCTSMESFLQALKFKDAARQEQICALPAEEAAAAADAETDWKQTGMLYFRGEEYDRFEEDYVSLQRRAYEALLGDPTFRAALDATGTARFRCPDRPTDELRTTFTAGELCRRLKECRRKLRRELNEASF